MLWPWLSMSWLLDWQAGRINQKAFHQVFTISPSHNQQWKYNLDINYAFYPSPLGRNYNQRIPRCAQESLHHHKISPILSSKLWLFDSLWTSVSRWRKSRWKKSRLSTSRSYSNLTKAGPQASVGKANQNYVKFWYEAEQTGPARLSIKLCKKWALEKNWVIIIHIFHSWYRRIPKWNKK